MVGGGHLPTATPDLALRQQSTPMTVAVSGVTRQSRQVEPSKEYDNSDEGEDFSSSYEYYSGSESSLLERSTVPIFLQMPGTVEPCSAIPSQMGMDASGTSPNDALPLSPLTVWAGAHYLPHGWGHQALDAGASAEPFNNASCCRSSLCSVTPASGRSDGMGNTCRSITDIQSATGTRNTRVRRSGPGEDSCAACDTEVLTRRNLDLLVSSPGGTRTSLAVEDGVRRSSSAFRATTNGAPVPTSPSRGRHRMANGKALISRFTNESGEFSRPDTNDTKPVRQVPLPPESGRAGLRQPVRLPTNCFLRAAQRQQVVPVGGCNTLVPPTRLTAPSTETVLNRPLPRRAITQAPTSSCVVSPRCEGDTPRSARKGVQASTGSSRRPSSGVVVGDSNMYTMPPADLAHGTTQSTDHVCPQTASSEGRTSVKAREGAPNPSSGKGDFTGAQMNPSSRKQRRKKHPRRHVARAWMPYVIPGEHTSRSTVNDLHTSPILSADATRTKPVGGKLLASHQLPEAECTTGGTPSPTEKPADVHHSTGHPTVSVPTAVRTIVSASPSQLPTTSPLPCKVASAGVPGQSSVPSATVHVTSVSNASTVATGNSTTRLTMVSQESTSAVPSRRCSRRFQSTSPKDAPAASSHSMKRALPFLVHQASPNNRVLSEAADPIPDTAVVPATFPILPRSSSPVSSSPAEETSTSDGASQATELRHWSPSIVRMTNISSRVRPHDTDSPLQRLDKSCQSQREHPQTSPLASKSAYTMAPSAASQRRHKRILRSAHPVIAVFALESHNVLTDSTSSFHPPVSVQSLPSSVSPGQRALSSSTVSTGPSTANASIPVCSSGRSPASLERLQGGDNSAHGEMSDGSVSGIITSAQDRRTSVKPCVHSMSANSAKTLPASKQRAQFVFSERFSKDKRRSILPCPRSFVSSQNTTERRGNTFSGTGFKRESWKQAVVTRDLQTPARDFATQQRISSSLRKAECVEDRTHTSHS